MQKAPVLKGSGLAPIDDEPVHVFGRNLEARVVEAPENDNKKEDEAKQEDDDVETIKKRKFETITGEENEETVFQGEFKLFVWDISSSNWIEKGRGQLKLNDDLKENRSRLIMRISGTYRIILNVAIRHSFFKVISNTKTSIRFSDGQNVWAASGSNAKQLGDLINERITEAARQAQTPKELNNEEDNAASQDHGEEKGEQKADDHSHSNDAASTEEKSSDRTKKTDNDGQKESEYSDREAEEEEKGSSSCENEEKDSDRGENEEDDKEAGESKDPKTVESSDHDYEKVANTKTVEDGTERHLKDRDETKRLKLSAD